MFQYLNILGVTIVAVQSIAHTCHRKNVYYATIVQPYGGTSIRMQNRSGANEGINTVLNTERGEERTLATGVQVFLCIRALRYTRAADISIMGV